MFDLSTIDDIEMEYEYRSDGTKSYYSEVDGKGGRIISPSKDTIRFTIRDDDRATDSSIYQIVLKSSDGNIKMKGDFFEAPDAWYDTSVSLTDKHAVIISEDASERMVLKCYKG